MAAVLERFDRMERTRRAGRLLAGKLAPATEQELDALRAAVQPFSVPEEVLTLLRWSNGWEDGDWPVAFASGGINPVRNIIESYRQMCDEPSFRSSWNPLWMPLFHESWTEGSVELLPAATSVIIHTYWTDDVLTITAPTVAAELDAVADLLDAGLLDENPDTLTAAPSMISFDRRRKEIVERTNARHGWSRWPHAHQLSFGKDRSDHPQHWRDAADAWPDPVEPNYPDPPATPTATDTTAAAVTRTSGSASSHAFSRARRTPPEH